VQRPQWRRQHPRPSMAWFTIGIGFCPG